LEVGCFFLIFFSVQKSVSSSKVIKGFFLQKGLSQNYVFLNAHSLPLNCKIGKKGEYGFSVFFCFGKMENFYFHFRKVVSLNDLDKVVQLARRGTLKHDCESITRSQKNGFTITKMFLMFDISEERKRKKAEKMLSKMTPVHTTDFWSTRNLFNLRLIRN